MQDLLNKTLSQIVTENFLAAPVFEKYGLDYCCKGKRQLQKVCTENGISAEGLISELGQAMASDVPSREFNNMSLTELAEYIVRVHHTYVKIQMPQILGYIQRVATKHGDSFPYMREVYTLFFELKEEMDQHMIKEEKILFPRIKLLELQAAGDQQRTFIQSPVEVMEAEHDHAGTTMERIRKLTSDYTAPQQACTTFRLALDSLEAFEKDLHLHVHLENNILFPRALELFNEAPACSLV